MPASLLRAERKTRFAFPSTHTCVLTGAVFGSLTALLSHHMGLSAAAAADSKSSDAFSAHLCASSDHSTWLLAAHHLLWIALNHHSRRLASAASSAASSAALQSNSSAGSAVPVPRSAQEWLHCPLFQNGLEATEKQSANSTAIAAFLQELVRGDTPPASSAPSGALSVHKRVLDSPEFKLFVKQSELTGPEISAALRAVVAALLKHSAVVTEAMSYAAALTSAAPAASGAASPARGSVSGSSTASPPPMSVVRIWRTAYNLLSDLISHHQNARITVCVKSGCEALVTPDPSKPGKYETFLIRFFHFVVDKRFAVSHPGYAM